MWLMKFESLRTSYCCACGLWSLNYFELITVSSDIDIALMILS